MHSLWSPSGTYLNTASYGLPPTPAWDALQDALEDWRHGRTSWEHWGVPGEEARKSFARLVGVPVQNIAIAANVSTLLGMVAASVPAVQRTRIDLRAKKRTTCAQGLKQSAVKLDLSAYGYT